MRPTATPDVSTLAAATWLASGAVLLGLTPLPLHDATLGWSPAFWLLAAPALVLLGRRTMRAWPTSHRAQARVAIRAWATAHAPTRRHRAPHHAAVPVRLACMRRNSSRMMRS